MILAFKREGWFSRKKVLIFLNSIHSYDHIFLKLPAIKKYYAGVNLELIEMKRLRDFLTHELHKMEDSTDE